MDKMIEAINDSLLPQIRDNKKSPFISRHNSIENSIQSSLDVGNDETASAKPLLTNLSTNTMMIRPKTPSAMDGELQQETTKVNIGSIAIGNTVIESEATKSPQQSLKLNLS